MSFYKHPIKIYLNLLVDEYGFICDRVEKKNHSYVIPDSMKFCSCNDSVDNSIMKIIYKVVKRKDVITCKDEKNENYRYKDQEYKNEENINYKYENQECKEFKDKKKKLNIKNDKECIKTEKIAEENDNKVIKQ